MDDCNSDKQAKGTKKCVIKRIIKLIDYKNCLFKNEIILKLQQRFKSEAHTFYTTEINIVASSNNDGKRLQTFDNITSYPYGTSVGKVCKTELLNKYKRLTSMIIQMEIKQNTIQSSHIFQIIHTEY